MYEIAISDHQDHVAVPRDRLEEIARGVLEREGAMAAELSVALLDSQAMRHLNRDYLGHDYDTDVLSFLFDVAPDIGKYGLPRGAGKRIEGEVLISTAIALQAAAEHRWPVADEIALYLVHGLLHLLGYDDQTDAERAIMRERERFHLSFWKVDPPGRDLGVGN